MGKPTAAPAHFPCMDHKTVAEIDAERMDIAEQLRSSWCDQCQKRVSGKAATKCVARFCSLQSRLAA